MTAGERIGLIKFGSRVDVVLGPEWEIVVREGMRVAGGIERARAAQRRGAHRRRGIGAREQSGASGMPGLNLRQR